MSFAKWLRASTAEARRDANKAARREARDNRHGAQSCDQYYYEMMRRESWASAFEACLAAWKQHSAKASAKGGKSKSPAKSEAARKNGARGGRPKSKKNKHDEK